MSASLITALALEGADGQFVPLLGEGRGVSGQEGLIGLTVRERVRAKPGRHGVINTTKFRDSPPIVLRGWVRGASEDETWDAYNDVARACAAATAADRKLRWSGGSVLELAETEVRLVSLSAPMEAGPNLIRYQLTLRPGDPRSFTQAETIAEGGPLAMAAGGLEFPLIFPISFAPAGGSSAELTVEGTDTTPFVARVYGYARDPVVRLLSTGEELRVLGEIDAGRYLELDTRAREVRLDDGTVLNSLYDYERSSWFELPPGPQTVQLLASSFDASARLQLRFFPAYA